MPSAELLHCAYSYHVQPFQTITTGGLESYLFRLQTEGYSQMLVHGAMIDVEPGDLLIFRPGDSYRLLIDEHPLYPVGHSISSGDYFIFCQGPWIDAWWERQHRPTIIHLDQDEGILSIWRMLIIENRKLGHDNPELVDYLLRSLLLQFDQAIEARTRLHGKPFVAARMLAFIEEHAITPFRLEELAAHVGLSVSRAVHLFKECYGKTIVQYTHEVRLAAAEERIKYSSMTLEQIADTCGFGNYSYFYRVFRKKFGVSPAVYRTDWLRKAER